MPTTLTGLLLFVVLLLPGFLYLVGKERVGTERRASPFRETIAVVAASVVAELAVVLATAVVWTRHIDFERLVREPGEYWRCHPALFAWWAVGLLLGAAALAYAATVPGIRRQLVPKQLRHKDKFAYPHPSSVSGWWMMFEHYYRDKQKHVGLVLDDGSFISGTRLSFNTDANDTPDRDIVLVAPIMYRPPGKDQARPYATSMACISARRIVTMFVTVKEPPGSPTSSPSAAETADEAEAEDQQGTQE